MFQTVWNLGLVFLSRRDEVAGLLYDDSGDLNARTVSIRASAATSRGGGKRVYRISKEIAYVV